MSDLVKMPDIINIYNTYDSEEAREQVIKLSPINAIVIPDNPTNGDMVKVMFPNAEIKMIKSDSTGYIAVYVRIGKGDKNGADFNYFDYDWWNAPYLKGENNE